MRNVINFGGSFFLVTSKDYDRDIDILHSEDQNFNASFDRFTEPGLLKVFDSMVIENDGIQKNIMKILMKVGDFLYLDSLYIDDCY